MNTTVKYLLLIIISYLLLECTALVGLKVLQLSKGITYKPIGKLGKDQIEILERFTRGDKGYISFDQSRGWTVAPSQQNELYRSNSAGIRASREYSRVPPQDTLRVTSFGDSFTHCDDVENHHTWQHYIEAGNNQIEVLNFGVSAYGPGQAYLRYQQEKGKYPADVVLIGFMSENIYRSVNTFRPYYVNSTQIPLAKPRFSFASGKLRLIESPITKLDAYQAIIDDRNSAYDKLGDDDFFYTRNYTSNAFDFSAIVRFVKIFHHTIDYKYNLAKTAIALDDKYNVESDAFRVTSNVLKAFYDEVTTDGAVPIIVLYPTSIDVERYRETGDYLYSPLTLFLKQHNLRHINLLPELERRTKGVAISDIYRTHFTPRGNRLVAEILSKQIASAAKSSVIK